MRLYSTKEAAEELGISAPRVKQLHIDLKVGALVGKSLVFTDHDLDRMRRRRQTIGRPPIRQPKPPTKEQD